MSIGTIFEIKFEITTLKYVILDQPFMITVHAINPNGSLQFLFEFECDLNTCDLGGDYIKLLLYIFIVVSHIIWITKIQN